MIMRFSYSVVGPVKFLSHLDLLKLFSKAIKRAEIPIAYSEGFNPHPKIAFGPPRGVAVAGLNEYCDMKLTIPMAEVDFINQLNIALPKGITANSAVLLQDKPTALMAVINIADYEIIIPWQDDLTANVQGLLEANEMLFVRHNPKKADKTINLRAGIKSLSLGKNSQGEAVIKMSLKFGESGGIKPSEIASVLQIDPAKALITRTGLYIEDGVGNLEPPC